MVKLMAVEYKATERWEFVNLHKLSSRLINLAISIIILYSLKPHTFKKKNTSHTLKIRLLNSNMINPYFMFEQ